MRLVGNYHNNYIQLIRKKESQTSKEHTNTIKFRELISDIRKGTFQHNTSPLLYLLHQIKRDELY